MSASRAGMWAPRPSRAWACEHIGVLAGVGAQRWAESPEVGAAVSHFGW